MPHSSTGAGEPRGISVAGWRGNEGMACSWEIQLLARQDFPFCKAPRCRKGARTVCNLHSRFGHASEAVRLCAPNMAKIPPRSCMDLPL